MYPAAGIANTLTQCLADSDYTIEDVVFVSPATVLTARMESSDELPIQSRRADKQTLYCRDAPRFGA